METGVLSEKQGQNKSFANVEIETILEKGMTIFTKIIIDGQDVSEKISKVSYHHEGGESPRLNVEYIIGDARISLNGVLLEDL